MAIVKKFNSISEAKDFVNHKSKDWTKIDCKIRFMIDDKIVTQEHLTFEDKNSRTQYNISIIEYLDFTEVHENSFSYNDLVLSCINEDMESFNNALLLPQTNKAIILAFKHAIYNDNLEMVSKFLKNDLINQDMMGNESPLRTATIHDSKECFFYLLDFFEKHNDVLAQILWNNAKKTLEKINGSTFWRNMIFVEPYTTDNWVYYLLEKKSNEAIELYKKIIED